MKLLTVDEVAVHLDRRPGWIYERVRSGELPAVRIGKYVRFRPEVVADWSPEPKPPTRPRWTPGYRRTYQTWHDMKRRCTDESRRDWQHYGGRGITVCDRWQSFDNFLADMGERPEGYQIDRTDNDGGYEPANCRWVTPAENNRNRRQFGPGSAKGA